MIPPVRQDILMSSGYHSVIYGPIKSRVLGQSLGVNPVPSPREGCPSPCIYCDTGTPGAEPVVGRASGMPSAGVVVTGAARRIIELSKGGDKVASIVVAGNGEPTRHAGLREITENLRDLRNKWFPKAVLHLQSCKPFLDTPSLAHTLGIYDKPVIDFGWGSGRTFRSATGGTGADYKRLIELCASLDKLVVRAVFVTGGPDNSTEKEVSSWVRKIGEIQPREIQVTTIPAVRGKKPKPVTPKKLAAIAEWVGEETGITTAVVSDEARLA